MKRVLFLFVTMPVGGAEMLCFHFLKGLDRSRFEPLVCCIQDFGELGLEIRGAGHEVISLGRMRTRRFEVETVFTLANLLKSRQIDIIHTNMYHANLYGRLGALLLGRRRPGIVTAVHSLYTERKPHRLLISRLLNRWTDRILAVSEAVREDVLRYERAEPWRVEVLPLGADFERLDVDMSPEEARERIGLSPSDWVLGTVGRLVEPKGHRYMLESLSILHERGLPLKLVIAGGGRLEAELRRQVAESGLENHVLLLGTRRDIPEIYRAMDLYVMASVSEAASMALLEAMAVGLPCVVTSVGGMVDLVDGGRCARVAPPADAPALASAIEDLYGSREERLKLGSAAMERARSLYGRDAMIRGLESIYDGLFSC
ncbi:MAG: glycosyltransferase [Syntrophobacteraceae bacterium]|jgi:glycosyltransferase involved in cell wall biosynthesis|nr:glycosyltransferase [Syntrophobacteraceae bacterium]